MQYINHSCDPNVAFDTTAFKLVALKDIKAGDELVFFYPSTGGSE
jgi:SET domain-containing protein